MTTTQKNPTQNPAIEDFISQVARLSEYDYGDFKRKAGAYLVRMEANLGPRLAPAARRQLSTMKELLLFHPTFNIGQTQRQTIRAAEMLNTLLQ